MKKFSVLSWLLLGSLVLSACGGAASSWVESSTSQPPAQSVEPAQSVMQPVTTLPDASVPDASAPDTSAPDTSSSQGEPDASQAPDVSEPPAVTVKPASPPKPQVTKPKPQPEPEPAPDQSQPAADPEPEPQPDPKPAASKETASAYIGKSVSSLIAAIGQPKGSDYAPSCLGDGEDGELFYDGFTVYTYRVNGTETVQDVV